MKKIIFSFVFMICLNLKAEENKIPKVAIIGGGMSGVSTGAFLKDKNLEVHLFEKEARLGGHVRTFPLPGAPGRLVNVDLGPQYINPKGWAVYVDFLRYFGMYNLDNFYKLGSTITIFQKGAELPNFVTPGKPGSTFEWLSKKDEAVNRLFSMLVFMDKSYRHNIKTNKPNISLQQFLDENKIDRKFQDEIIKPLIATSFTSPIQRVGETAITTTSGVLAFQSPLRKANWYVSKSGLQPYIEAIGKMTKASASNYQIHLSTPVTRVAKNLNGTFKVQYGNGQEMDFDYVVFAVHAPVAAEILKDYPAFKGLWNDMTYTYNKVVIHTDRSFIHDKFPAFYNVKVREDKTCAMAMNLQMVSPDFGQLIKSWGLTEEEYQKIKREGHFVAESNFMHPMQTVVFLERLKQLKAIAAREGNIYFAGGWSMEFETQFNAILSGFGAASFIAPDIVPYWKAKMPTLRKI